MSKNRYLVCIGDTEGVPNKNELWNLFFLINAVVIHEKAEGSTKVEKIILHSCSFAHEANLSESKIKRTIQTTIDYLNFLKKLYKADGFLFVFWNARHDKHVLEKYMNFFEMNAHFIDLLQWAKTRIDTHSFSINNLLKAYNFDEPEKHLAFSDTIDMINLMFCIWFTKPGLTNKEIKDKVLEHKQSKLLTDIFQHESFTKLVNKSIMSKVEVTKTKKKQTNNYEYYTINQKSYKVRKGWSTLKHNGYGLYIYNDAANKYDPVRDQEAKQEILLKLNKVREAH